MLTRSPQEDIITPGASTVAKFKTLMWSFARFLLVLNRALVNAFYVWTDIPTQCPLSYRYVKVDFTTLSTA